MKAVILAAGEGSRMRPLTYTRPKVMLPLANKPLLEHLLVQVRDAGITDYVFIVGYCDQQVRDYFGRGDRWGVNITYASQRKQQGTADALRAVEGLLEGSFLMLNGDVLVKADHVRRLAALGGNAMALVEVKDATGLGVVETRDGKAVRIYEKTEKPPFNLANAGLYLFDQDVFKALAVTPKSARGEYEITDTLQLLIDTHHDVSAMQIDTWMDLTYPWDLLQANAEVLLQVTVHNLGQVEPNAVLKGPVSIGKNTVVRSGAYLVGPIIIGEGCDIGPNCFIRAATSIGNNCHIGAAVEVKNSIIMRGTKVPHLNYVGDSVIGEDCNFGAGTKVANLRLDSRTIAVDGKSTGLRKLGVIAGDKVETGINASINVGTMIGNNTFIGPGAVATGVIAPGSRIF